MDYDEEEKVLKRLLKVRELETENTNPIDFAGIELVKEVAQERAVWNTKHQLNVKKLDLKHSKPEKRPNQPKNAKTIEAPKVQPILEIQEKPKKPKFTKFEKKKKLFMKKLTKANE